MRVRARVLFGDACSFTHGVVDPIVELGALALARGIGLHVDNCLGGYLLSYMRRSGAFQRGVRAAGLIVDLWAVSVGHCTIARRAAIARAHRRLNPRTRLLSACRTTADFDFSVPGVTTISCDLHKYGNSSKGVSVVGFRSAELRRLTYVPSVSAGRGPAPASQPNGRIQSIKGVGRGGLMRHRPGRRLQVDGCEGLYVTPTLQGSRAGGTVAQAWATVLHFGDDGYRKMASDVHGVCLQIGAIVGAPDTVAPHMRRRARVPRLIGLGSPCAARLFLSRG
eukprot:COSAG01_NODE_6174_length_3811_cov_2.428879_1_plen_280_part_00